MVLFVSRAALNSQRQKKAFGGRVSAVTLPGPDRRTD
jgi:hypothetical protein